MKRLVIVIFILLFFLVFLLCVYFLSYEYINSAIDSFDVGYCKMLNKAFFAHYNWDGTADGMNIILPEEYNKTKITGLGGYTGKGCNGRNGRGQSGQIPGWCTHAAKEGHPWNAEFHLSDL